MGSDYLPKIPDPLVTFDEAVELFEVPPYDPWLGLRDMLDLLPPPKVSQWPGAHKKAIAIRIREAINDAELRPIANVAPETLVLAEVVLWALLTASEYTLEDKGNQAKVIFRLKVSDHAREQVKRRCARDRKIGIQDIEALIPDRHPIVMLAGQAISRADAAASVMRELRSSGLDLEIDPADGNMISLIGDGEYTPAQGRAIRALKPELMAMLAADPGQQPTAQTAQTTPKKRYDWESETDFYRWFWRRYLNPDNGKLVKSRNRIEHNWYEEGWTIAGVSVTRTRIRAILDGLGGKEIPDPKKREIFDDFMAAKPVPLEVTSR